MNKHFRATLIDETDEDLIENTFACYLAFGIFLIGIILDQWQWNFITVVASLLLALVIYRVGYRLGINMANH